MMPIAELLALKIENLELRKRQLEAAHAALNEEQTALIALARTEAQAPDGYLYDLATRTFHPPPAPAKRK